MRDWTKARVLEFLPCERLAEASTEQIEQWGERVLVADTLEDVFREN